MAKLVRGLSDNMGDVEDEQDMQECEKDIGMKEDYRDCYGMEESDTW